MSGCQCAHVRRGHTEQVCTGAADLTRRVHDAEHDTEQDVDLCWPCADAITAALEEAALAAHGLLAVADRVTFTLHAGDPDHVFAPTVAAGMVGKPLRVYDDSIRQDVRGIVHAARVTEGGSAIEVEIDVTARVPVAATPVSLPSTADDGDAR